VILFGAVVNGLCQASEQWLTHAPAQLVELEEGYLS
jgi:hypothetical protein